MRVGPTTYTLTPLSHLRPGMQLLIEDHGHLVEHTVRSVAREPYEGPVYDLEVDGTHNYVANGILVHNSIYGWRSADIRNILGFEHDYPNARTVTLEQNYRSTQTILDAAHAVVSKNHHRTPKRLWTDNAAGPALRRYTARDELDEGTWIAQAIQRLCQSGACTPRDCAVMYRTNAQSRAIEEAFMRLGIPYALVGGVRFYERREVKDVVAYLRTIVNPRDDASLTRILNVPPRRIGPSAVKALRAYAAAHQVSLRATLQQAPFIADIPTAGRKGIRDLAELLDRLTIRSGRDNLLDLLDDLLATSGYLAWLKDGTDDGDERAANVAEIRSLALAYAAAPPPDGLREFLEDVALVADTDQLPNAPDVDPQAPPPDVTVLTTIHAAKGLEFPAVFVAGMEEGIFPHSRGLDDPAQMEEERRLAYVAITRAKTYLYLLNAWQRTLFGNLTENPVSRFIATSPISSSPTPPPPSRAYPPSSRWRASFPSRPPRPRPSAPTSACATAPSAPAP